MRKIEYNVPPVTYKSRMYAKNRIQYAAGNVNEPNVCEKPNTICRRNVNEPAPLFSRNYPGMGLLLGISALWFLKRNLTTKVWILV
ncbi:hypothetical protein ACN6KS_19275 [Paenibacillus nitricinens]|uniref:hypothetical protein n=1 Tax=Paenibacillus nitricinens TaxID=3367691 RepID=UPI003F878551